MNSSELSLQGMVSRSYPASWPPVLLHHYFLQHALVTPNALAIIRVDEQWTYEQLLTYSLQYAAVLDECGLRPGDRVILDLHPTPQAIALICACSMLGLIFVPVDPDLPQPRAEYIVETTEARLHIQAAPGARQFPHSQHLLTGILDKDRLNVEGEVPSHLRSRRGPVLESDLVSITFTSTTTGRPKGIMMTHRAVLAFFRAVVAYCNLGKGERVSSIGPLDFESPLLDMGLALGSGSTLVQVPRMLLHYNSKKLLRYLDTHAVTQFNSVEHLWRMFAYYAPDELAKLAHLKTGLFSGKPYIPALERARSLRPSLRLISCFGPAESVACSFADVPNPIPPGTDNLPIGTAHPGAEMLLFDEQEREITTPGAVGEIYLRGANLCSGYWRDPEATAAALVPHPLRPYSGEKVFRTGDFGFKGEHGELYFKERRDLQVKVMGMRTEIEEIELRLREHPAVADAVVLLYHRMEEPMLAAYVEPTPGTAPPAVTELRRFCAETLPSFMIPSQIHHLEALPTTSGGNDRQAIRQIWERTAMKEGER